jgi:Zn-dependent protease with chaperone function
MPGEGRGALAVAALSGASILILFEFLVLLRHFGKGKKVEKGLEHLMPFLPWGLSYLVWGGFRLESFVRFDFGGNSEALAEILILLPYLWFELLLLLGEFRVYGKTRSGFRVRATWLVLPFFLLVLLLFDLLSLEPHLRAILDSFSFGLGLGLGLSIVILVLFLPLWTRLILGLQPLEDPSLTEGFQQIDERAQSKVAGAYLLSTGSRIFNAAVVGFFRWTRLIMFTDLLLELLSPRQVLGVYAHEVAHIKQHHMLRLLTFFLLTPWLLSFGVPWILGDTSEETQLLVFGGFLILMVPLYKRYSRMMECDADLNARSFLGDSGPLIESLREGEILVPGSGEKAGFRHPSTEARISFLQRLDENPERARIFRSQMKRFQGWLFVLLGLGFGFAIPRLRAQWREEYPEYLLDIGYPEKAYSMLLDLAPERVAQNGEGKASQGPGKVPLWLKKGGKLKEDQREFFYLLDEASRAYLLVEARGERGTSALPILRRLAHKRASKALRDKDLDAALGWLGLYLRWGEGSLYQRVLYQFLRSLQERDEKEQSIQRKRLRILLAHYPTDPALIPPRERMQ